MHKLVAGQLPSSLLGLLQNPVIMTLARCVPEPEV